MSFAHRSVRRRQAEVYGLLIFTGWAGLGCTSLLDIDDEYALGTSTGGTGGAASNESGGFVGGELGGSFNGSGGATSQSGGAGPIDAGSGGGFTANGGTVASNGGISSATGGSGAEPATGGTAVTGGGGGKGGVVDVPDAGGLQCTTGSFSGTFKGMHSPSVTFVGVPLPVNGAVTFRLLPSGTPGKLKVAEAHFDGDFDLIPGAAQGVPFTATMVGDYDCETGKLTGDLVDGKFADSEARVTYIAFTGTFSATYGTSFSGTWAERETASPPSNLVKFEGDGDFTASRVLR